MSNVNRAANSPPLKSIAYRLADSPVPAHAVPADRITHLNHAFARIGRQGQLVSGYPAQDFGAAFAEARPLVHERRWEHNGGNFGEYLKLKAGNPELRTLLSVGGWEWSDNFSDLAADAPLRRRFCRDAAQFLEQFGFDGIDLDWEYPNGGGHEHNSRRPDDLVNFTALVEDLREALERRSSGESGKRYLLSAATSASVEKTLLVDYHRLGQSFDFINVMTYDYTGEWNDRSGHHAALFPQGAAAIGAHRQAGLGPGQINLGVPFYGRQWRVTGGLGSPVASAPRPLQTGLGSGITWREIKQLLPHGVLHEDTDALAAWLAIDWVGETGLSSADLPDPETVRQHGPAGRIISCDTPAILQAKADWLRAQGLGGVMFWELGGDDGNELVDALWRALQK